MKISNEKLLIMEQLIKEEKLTLKEVIGALNIQVQYIPPRDIGWNSTTTTNALWVQDPTRTLTFQEKYFRI